MNEATQAIVFNVLAVMLPLVPAVVLFKFLPSSGSVEGPFKGLQVKFGGAFAAYLILFVIMWEGRPVDFHHFHNWTVIGTVELHHSPTEPPASPREVVGRVTPPKFEVMNEGKFSFDIPVMEDENGDPMYPDLQINVRDYAGVTVNLAKSDALQGGDPGIQKVYDNKKRVIRLTSPIVLSSPAMQPSYGAQAQTPMPTAPAAATPAGP